MARKRSDPAPETRAAILRAVCERPNDDTPRLLYAEFLEGTGDPNDIVRAEFIRVQCELARTDLSATRWSELQKRQDALEDNCERWAEELPHLDGIIWNAVDFKRGFVWELLCNNTEVFKRNAAAIFASTPIQGVTLIRLQSLAQVLDVAELSRVKRLILEGLGLGPIDTHALAESPHVSNLAAIHLSDNNIEDEGAEALAASQQLRFLENLDLGYNRIADEGVKALAASPIVATLSHLGLAGNLLTNSGAMALASSQYLGQLTGLTLWECKNIGLKGKKALENRFGNVVSFED